MIFFYSFENVLLVIRHFSYRSLVSYFKVRIVLYLVFWRTMSTRVDNIWNFEVAVKQLSSEESIM